MMNKRGEMGVGTLIIFIALLLVAAVAAGVLIQTAGSLQQRALSTGTQATSQVSSNALVLEVSGTDGTTTLENFTQTMRLSPGSDAIQLSAVTLTFSTRDSTTTYTYSGSGAYTVNATNNNGTFGVTWIQNGPNSQTGVLVRGDVIRVLYQAPRTITAGEDVRINFIPRVGTPTMTLFTIPDVISTQRVYLYP